MLLKLMDDSELLLSSLLRHTAVENVQADYWNEQNLYSNVKSNGQTIHYKWDALTGKQHLL
ncbi:hypothetical protein T3H97_13070 [Paenibacillus sp. LX16]|uniref:hypothetical protein n=1 Tax=Paenibacillus sp. LX16 TaxID=1740264 RepID=UPI002E2C5D48|nr:hypothetical protein [Paenibacillus sp. LX16]